jgi:methionine aminopeptidase
VIILKSAEEIAAMRRAGRVVAEAHALVRELVKPGITTWDLDQAVEEFLLKQNAVPAFKGYQGYPASICASVNEVVVHGIPSREVVQTAVYVQAGALRRADHALSQAPMPFFSGFTPTEFGHLLPSFKL